jgi:hypothetical protein
LIVTHGHLDHIGCLPALVKDDLIRPDWALVIDPALAWGRSGADATWDAGLDARTRAVLAGLREELRSPATDDRTLGQFLQDAATLEDSYLAMLTTLDQRGTKVVRYGADETTALSRAFASAGLQIIGPTMDHLKACAGLIAGTGDAAVQAAKDAIGGDSSIDAVDAYRQIIQSDAAADAGRLGAAVNLQSIVTTFAMDGKSVFLGGDMQFADPQVNNAVIAQSVAALRQSIKDGSPYTVAKLSHHGSDNAFDEEIFADFGATKYFGICAGAGSKHHPNPATLDILKAHTDSITWARTDHNGQSTFDLSASKPDVRIAMGELNDAVPNSPDTGAAVLAKPGPRPPAAATRPTVLSRTLPAPAGSEVIEVTTRIPVGALRVTVAIDVEPHARVAAQASSAPASPAHAGARPNADQRTLSLAGGRQLPQLLFVTSPTALVSNIGAIEARTVLDALAAKGLPVEALPAGIDSDAAVAAVRARLAKEPKIVGVVLLGGHDGVPARRLDCLPADLRARVGASGDADRFIVWSDDAYGDRDGDGLPELPVSRIPDGRSADLVFGALQAGAARRSARVAGIRNIARPFAAGIFAGLPGAGQMLISTTTVFNQTPAYSLDADNVYLMLHGDYSDSKRFWGENTPNDVEAVNVNNVPQTAGRIVFTGCCWGGLSVDPPAGRSIPGQAVAAKTAADSIALSFLQNGAVAFVGCTGSHYSPTIGPYQYFGGPMHSAFWSALGRGLAPAEALFAAKVQYIRGLPYGQTSVQGHAIGYKILRQYTCLGLGW